MADKVNVEEPVYQARREGRAALHRPSGRNRGKEGLTETLKSWFNVG